MTRQDELPRLIAESPEAKEWVENQKTQYLNLPVFGEIAIGVLWSDATHENGNPIVPIDPAAFADEININGLPVLKGHDPGFPLGKVLIAKVFTDVAGGRFIAAILGLYSGGNPPRFADLGLNPTMPVSPPSRLPALPKDTCIKFGVDPREIDEDWLEDVLRAAPLPVERTPLSHNAAEALHELIRLALPYLVIVWNPFVTAIASEAGKDVYAGMHAWLRTLFKKLSDRRNPILEIQSWQNDCQVSFVFRGKDIGRHYMAHDALPIAGTQAADLIGNMKKAGNQAKKILYEFDAETERWFPSFAELNDGQFVTDNYLLIAVEQLPSHLSIGISYHEEASPDLTDTVSISPATSRSGAKSCRS